MKWGLATHNKSQNWKYSSKLDSLTSEVWFFIPILHFAFTSVLQWHFWALKFPKLFRSNVLSCLIHSDLISLWISKSSWICRPMHSHNESWWFREVQYRCTWLIWKVKYIEARWFPSQVSLIAGQNCKKSLIVNLPWWPRLWLEFKVGLSWLSYTYYAHLHVKNSTAWRWRIRLYRPR